MYQKPGKFCQLLLASSAHPSHICRNLSLSIAYRVRRLCSMTDHSSCAWQDLKQHLKLRQSKAATVPTQITSRFVDQLEALKSRGYKERAVLYQFQLVLLRSREEVMEKVVRTEEERAIILALPFDRRLPDAAGILHQHYNLLVQRNPGVKEWMVRAPMVAHLRPANLRDFLVRAKLPQVNRRGRGASRGDQPGFKKCGKARCLCCVYSSNSRTHTSTLTGQTWPIKQSITCDDHSVVYNVTCSHQAGPCLRRPAQYVGKVGATRACRVRCTEHRGAARNYFNTDGRLQLPPL